MAHIIVNPSLSAVRAYNIRGEILEAPRPMGMDISGMDTLTLEVHMTSLSWMFIHVSQLTRWPLYVSPFFNSTSFKQNIHTVECTAAYTHT